MAESPKPKSQLNPALPVEQADNLERANRATSEKAIPESISAENLLAEASPLGFQDSATAASSASVSPAPAATSPANAELDAELKGELANAALRSRLAELEDQLRQCQTELHQSRAQQQRSESQFQGLLDGVDAAIAQIQVWADGRWDYLFCSAGYELVFGYSAREFLAEPGCWLNQVHEDDRAIAQTILSSILAFHPDAPADQRTFAVEYRFFHKTTGWRWISTRFHQQTPIVQDTWLVNV
ncbi:MAG: hypothetical protein D6742_02240, partial [Cyanobacteria bacterium J069]